MRNIFIFSLCFVAVFLYIFSSGPGFAENDEVLRVELPEVKKEGNTSVEEALSRRRSVRSYADEPLELKEIGQLVWAAQGITEPERGFRTAPSAGALYPLEVYVIVGWAIPELEAGIYRYHPEAHELEREIKGE